MIHYIRPIEFNKKFSFGKIQHFIQETNSRHFQQLENSYHTSIENKKKISFTFISRVDLDSYPFHNVLPCIQKDTSIDIP